MNASKAQTSGATVSEIIEALAAWRAATPERRKEAMDFLERVSREAARGNPERRQVRS